MRVFKYPLHILHQQDVQMPRGANILSVDRQNDFINIWALVDENETEMEVRQFRVVGTGHDFKDPGHFKFLSTVIFEAQGLVFHVFEKVLK